MTTAAAQPPPPTGTTAQPLRLTWSTLGVPVLGYRRYVVSQLLVVVVGERRALPAQTFRSLQTARGRREEPLVRWGCRGAPVQEKETATLRRCDRKSTTSVFQQRRFSLPATAKVRFSLRCELTLFYPIKGEPGAEAERGAESQQSGSVPPPRRREARLTPTHLEERGPNGVLKQATPRCRRFLKACSTSLPSEAESRRQKLPFPGSSWERATFRK